MKKILYVFRTQRKSILFDYKNQTAPDSMLFGLNHLRSFGYKVDFFDDAFSPFNIYHPLFYLFEHAIINEVGMGFKLDQAVLLLPKVNQYGVIVCTGDSAGLPFLFLKYLGLLKKPIIILSSGLTGALRTNPDSWVIKFYRKIYTALDILTVYSDIEREFFVKHLNIPNDKIYRIPYGTDWNFYSKVKKVKPSLISAVGIDSGRDYKTFFSAVKDLDEQVVIACHPDNIKGLSVPNNVVCRFLINPLEVRDLFQQSKVVVVPCHEKYRSAGQMVVLEAAASGRPIVASSIKGIKGALAFEHKNHIFFVPPKDISAMREAIIYLLKNREKAEKMGIIASNFVRTHYTSKHLANNIAKLVTKL